MKLIDISDQWKEQDSVDNLVAAGGEIRLHTYMHLNGGGNWMRSFFLAIISERGKSHYSRGFEWCAGNGILGYDALGSNKCDHITFSDYYPVAIESCLGTAQRNNITHKVSAYVTPTISGIPESEKWDLVIGNPPHAFGSITETANYLVESGISGPAVDNVLRVLCDEGMEIHREFFQTISDHLLDDADIFLYEPGSCVVDIINLLPLIEEWGIVLVDQYPVAPYLDAILPIGMPKSIHVDGHVMHFKAKKT